jgi:hypothetical protein
LAYNAKYRYNYASGVEVAVPISETITVKTDEMGQKYALTSEAIQQTQPSTVIIAGFTETTNPNCLAGEFYVDYSISNNLLLFNSSQVEGDLTIAYNGLGTSVSIHSIRKMALSDPTKIEFEINNDKVGQIDSNGITIGTPYMLLVDERASGAAGGTFTSGDWRTRSLGTTPKVNTIQGASYDNVTSTITLPQGKYRISASCPAYRVDGHKSKLTNITDVSDLIIGSSQYGSNSTGTVSSSFIVGEFEIAGTKDIQIQHRCQTTFATFGFGISLSFGVVEVYAQVEIWKIG